MRRRDFFKRVVKGLPMLILATIPTIHALPLSATDCKSGCTGTCTGLCAIGCTHACRIGCLYTCNNMCRDACTGSCKTSSTKQDSVKFKRNKQ